MTVSARFMIGYGLAVTLAAAVQTASILVALS